ncbi:MAG: hypothetical protein ACYSW4_02105 [Planctomycetota bacterium]|jgi:hypothetical protein
MFTIDLLKGEGLPIKRRPEGIAVGAVTLAVPVIIAIVMFGLYLSNIIAISVQKKEIANYESKTDELSDAVELKESLEVEQEAIRSSLSEVASSVGRHTQWSPVLATVVENMPSSMVLTHLEVKQRSVKKEVPKKDDPHTKVKITVPVRTLRISVSGRPHHDYDIAVRDFGDRLRSSTVLGPKLEDIRVEKHDFGKLRDKNVVSYDIDCVFKPGL